MPITLVPSAPVLLAAGLDWLEGLLPVLFVIIWIVSQVWAVFRRAAGPQAPQGPRGGGPQGGPLVRPPRPRGAGEPPPAQRPDARGRTELERQIEAFLRESRGGQPPAPAEVAGPGERRPATAPAPGTRPARQAGGGQRRGTTTAGNAVRPAAAGGEAGAAGATDRAGAPRQREAATTTFGGDIARHVDAAFASDLKHRIAPATVPPAMPAATPALDEQQGAIVDLLRDPESLRRLVIIREVLDRPVERW
jgi:hypothetical protein